MAKTKQPAPQPKSGPVPIAGVMLSARAIIEQGRTEEFIAECVDKRHHMRASLEFLLFVKEFVGRPLAAEPSVTKMGAAPKPGAVAMTAKARKFTLAAGKCDNTFKKTA